jgi:DNA-binding PadR family transcriptional regulator
MSLKHALLGFLSYGPMTGYELKKFFDASVAHFWNAELSQIYPTLRQLESEDLVEMEVEVQADRPNRKVYSITDDGGRELTEWLAQPAETDRARDSLLIKVFFGATLPRQEVVGVLRHRVDELRRRIDQQEQAYVFIRKFADSLGLQREAFFWGLTLDCGVKNEKAFIDWTEKAIHEIEQLDDSSFMAERPGPWTFDVRRAIEVLEKLKTAMPDTFAITRSAKERQA